MTGHLVVAIDGPAGSGKSTVAKRVARALDCTLLDTGAIYRSLALVARERGVDWGDGSGLAQLAQGLAISFCLEGEHNRVLLGGRDVSSAIRSPEISMGASKVSAIPEVRQALLGLQRSVAREGPLVAEGRDMGTVVFPDATVKVFLDADPLVRARRRHLELQGEKQEVQLEQVLRQQEERDAADSKRAVAPLRAAEDAQVVDTSGLEIDEVVARVLELAQERGSAGQDGDG